MLGRDEVKYDYPREREQKIEYIKLNIKMVALNLKLIRKS